MDRKAFLSSIGLSAGALFTASCLGGCSKASNNGPVAAPAVDFNLDLSQPANAALNTPGGYLYANGVIVAKTVGGNIIAVSQGCTHQDVTVQFIKDNSYFYCPGHGATFSATGAVTGGPASSPLKQYAVTVNGTIVSIKG
jgi:cytochrome b6-f complex iron-sulfur subunit